ncbi:uncharacterized protein BX664DRAFT_360647 [Halteromyces radiatus]|uniref:uncharacterized protein n=1 Tax=Halteromyces radiatus TaxID=101107 RepID=UPI00221EB081|nr:uncharacterized protein BX664DRAFT_360647 [Halteromyces radiatus]KAI8084820.1 hypothetical protein BX664DRAFT_360647 [Halteromyces radiatus]
MDTITNRLGLQSSKVDESRENQAEILDEQEQEQLLQDLRKQNEESNLMIQSGLLFVGVLVCAIFIVYLYEVYTHEDFTKGGRLPFPFLSTPVSSQVGLPYLGVLLSIGSLLATMATLMLTCRVTFSDLVHMSPSQRGTGQLHLTGSISSIAMGSVMPLLCLFSIKVTWVEVIFWLLPLMMLAMDLLAIYMMGQVNADFTELEKSRYKYKGA